MCVLFHFVDRDSIFVIDYLHEHCEASEIYMRWKFGVLRVFDGANIEILRMIFMHQIQNNLWVGTSIDQVDITEATIEADNKQ